MSDTSKLSTCQIVCWGLSALVGLFVMWSTSGAAGVLAALLLGCASAVFFGLVVTGLVCTGYRPGDRGIAAEDVKAKLREVTGITGYKAPDVPVSPAVTVTSAPEVATPQPASVKSDTLLQGEAELAARKGTWSYEGDAARTETKPPLDSNTGTRPVSLSAPKDGQADDLKLIKGVGPKLERLCHELGFYHFDQIAGWGPAEVAWVDDNLTGFKGRVSRDNWVAQAKSLAAGGTTEFSRRVGNGEVN
ncbi:MAG: NADH:ubiquinone oxidoreductase [Rhodobacteraceae bacterium CG17_big_fil_post_rev_8_21_14_2_50_63_15]|nr:NADH:ubiquinone oxidoreductase [Roseovarius sp.]PIV79841.1 MAG: NADH:ubiquinone oxidoreductase [Rhodobacteraceae bacterium CG17_big_fil_post_rev_8_21_14_2_50_63_15]